MKLSLIKNIMKTDRNNGRKQYTISIPEVLGQLLEVEQNKILYIYNHKPHSFNISTTNPNQKQQEERHIFPNGSCNYFTLPVKLLEDMKDEQINKAIFNIDLEEIDEATQRRGVVSIIID